MRYILFLYFFFLAKPVLAVDGGSSPDFLSSAFKMLGGLLLVGGLLFVLYASQRKGWKFFASRKQGGIKINEMISLGGKSNLYLIEVRGKEFMIGTSSERIDLLYDFDPPEEGKNKFEKALQEKRGG